ncbi:hypothetical protein SDRG_14967 [Saprolegnia diclina VS20]|uniref:AMP-dependent synthetase/ligase domain-containing protein n=1 Tax=Saprolegnia diclina (strain VS20) TaxID=1156394 RepID=T0RCC0_SAPDV|nr:hypothetical protein SDRG_14967 [Saprolegnia diclina VS20]EQC27252.1 hypothetical protein SDRG_14967 [Saprolegnia diclina VS20]|eukprot:XP_008619351.1 hypothetical protein SDRG_14967 [Saprolegnia diclina VS20]
MKPMVILDAIKLAAIAFLSMLLGLLQPSPSPAIAGSFEPVDDMWAADDKSKPASPTKAFLQERSHHGSRTPATFEDLTIVELLKQRARSTPNKVVYTFLDDYGRESVNLTFGDLDRAARRVAATLQQDANLKKGDRVMLAYPPGLDFAMGFWGCLYAGATAVPVYPPYPGTLTKDLPKFNRMVVDSGAKVILTNRTYYMATQLATAKSFFSGSVTWPKDIQWFSTDAIAEDMDMCYTDVECSFDDLAFFQYSSGSTSEPKAVMVSYGNVNAQLKVWVAIRETDTMVSWVPSYHDMGLVVFILAPASTGTHFDPTLHLAFLTLHLSRRSVCVDVATLVHQGSCSLDAYGFQVQGHADLRAQLWLRPGGPQDDQGPSS